MRVKSSKDEGSYSTGLMAICDADFRFVYVDVRRHDQDKDTSIFSRSDICEMLENGNMPIPTPTMLHGELTPYFIIGDNIFPLKQWLMKPYPNRGLTDSQSTYNSRLSRATGTIENAFGILSARWRIFQRAIRADVSMAELIVKATCCLHNYLLSTDNARYLPSGNFREGDWRALVNNYDNPALTNPSCLGARNFSHESKEPRDHLCTYVNSAEGALSGHANHVASCGATL